MEALLSIVSIAAIAALFAPWVWLIVVAVKLFGLPEKKAPKYSTIKVLSLVGIFIATQIIMPIVTYLLWTEAKKNKDNELLGLAKVGLYTLIGWVSIIVLFLLLFVGLASSL